jgi:hypothetical protein
MVTTTAVYSDKLRILIFSLMIYSRGVSSTRLNKSVFE